MTEEFSITPSKAIDADLEIERPFSIEAAGIASHAVLPLYNGWARAFALENRVLRGEWRWAT